MIRRLCVLAVLLFAACDSDSTDSVTFGGVEVDAQGDATLRVDGGQLIVSNVGASGDDGFFLAGAPTSVDVLTEPIAIEAGQGFGIGVLGAGGEILAGFKNRNRSGGRFAFEITYADRLGVEAVRVVYLLNGRVVLDVPSLSFGGSTFRQATQSAGEGEGDTGSAHVVRRGGKYVVVSDSENSGEPRRAEGKGLCEGFTVTLPEGVEFGAPTLCADRIEVEPLGIDFPLEDVTGVAVTGRSLGEFRVRSLAVR